MKTYFCYERNFAGQWIPTLYFDRPIKKIQDTPNRSPVYEIDGEFTLAELESKYPKPDAQI